ncbi:MAG: N-6 DNA methylase [Bacteroidaceae bacterium]|nr:N-6 DNA methylase [Bacteroidaceae bacterium]
MLFQSKIIKKYITSIPEDVEKDAWQKYQKYFLNVNIQNNIQQSKEEQFQEGFLSELFVNILGYTLNPSPNFNLITEKKNETNSKKADGAILLNDDVIGVIELKDHKTTDLCKVEGQAFGYKSQHRNARYVVISNFEKLRLYIDNAVDYREWNLFTMKEKDFSELFLCLSWKEVEKGTALKMKSDSDLQEEEITQKLYRDYSLFKRLLFTDILKNNANTSGVSEKDWQLMLFKKTQKLLDRLLFIFFAEDCGLLPPNSIMRIIDQWNTLKDMDAYVPLYDRIKKFFGYLNTGHQGKHYEIFAYNGGLFLPDTELDSLVITDELLAAHTRKLSEYDFASDVDVNILGHIFENSLTEIEEITKSIEEGAADASQMKNSKRKKDGVFYTPQYITKYIVENTVGKLCIEKKQELGIDEKEYFADKKRQATTKRNLLDKLNNYREWLLQISILDPACGSGAFLNAALQFLMAEHKLIDEMEAKVTGSSLVFQDVEKSILEHNLYGVDINEESVEIARLSLWLRTAKPHRKLNSLNENIKCGNSLISDPNVAGEKAFDWQKEFPKVFDKGGFDIVIGNPPYGIFIENSLQNYYTSNFPLTKYKLNLYILFIERLFQIFNSGIVSFIIPTSLLVNSYYEDIRRYLLSNSKIIELFTITDKVFKEAEVGASLIITFEIKKNFTEENIIRLAQSPTTEDFISKHNIIENYISQTALLNNDKAEIVIQSKDSNIIEQKIKKFTPANNYYEFKNGLNPGNIKDKLITRTPNNLTGRIVWGKEIKRYYILWGGDYIIYDEHIADNLTTDDIKSKKGMNKQTKIDFALRSKSLFENEKLLIRKTGDRLICTYDDRNYYFDTLVHGIYKKGEEYSLMYLLAILNSTPATFFYRCLHDVKGKVFAKISLDDISKFPIPPIDEGTNSISKELCEDAKKMLLLNQQLQEKRSRFLHRLRVNLGVGKMTSALETFDLLDFKGLLSELKKQKIQISLSQQDEWEDYFNDYRQQCQQLSKDIDETNKQIDLKVYHLYDLTYDEVLIVDPQTTITEAEYKE